MAVCRIREGEVFLVSEKARKCGLKPDVLRAALLNMRAAISVRSPLGVVDTPRPDVRGDRAFSGFWVGAYEYRYGNKDKHGKVMLVVEPRVENYVEMVREAAALPLGVHVFALGSVELAYSLAVFTSAVAYLWEVYRAVSREPRFLTEFVESSVGFLDVAKGRTVLLRRRRVPNRALANAVVFALRRLVKDVEKARDFAKEMLGESPEVKKVAEFYLNYILHMAEAVLAEVGELAYWADGGEFGEYWRLALPVRGGGGRGGELARLFLVPSTKLYELYVLAQFLKAVGGDVELCGSRCLKVGNTRFYFNKAPVSRIIKQLTGRRPRPDISIKQGEKVVVVDAKYRELNRGRLALADAIRLAAYLLDVARNGRLTAVVVALEKPTLDHPPVIRTKLTPMLDIEVRFVKVNPSGVNEVRALLSELLA